MASMSRSMRGSRKFSRGGGGVQIPRRGLTENFNMAKINNLAILGEPDPPPPLDSPMWKSARETDSKSQPMKHCRVILSESKITARK